MTPSRNKANELRNHNVFAWSFPTNPILISGCLDAHLAARTTIKNFEHYIDTCRSVNLPAEIHRMIADSVYDALLDETKYAWHTVWRSILTAEPNQWKDDEAKSCEHVLHHIDDDLEAEGGKRPDEVRRAVTKSYLQDLRGRFEVARVTGDHVYGITYIIDVHDEARTDMQSKAQRPRCMQTVIYIPIRPMSRFGGRQLYEYLDSQIHTNNVSFGIILPISVTAGSNKDGIVKYVNSDTFKTDMERSAKYGKSHLVDLICLVG